MAYIDKDKIPYYLDTSEEAPMEGRKIAFKSDIDKIPPADVVEVVRCKECKHGDVSTFSLSKDGEEYIGCYCSLKNAVTNVDYYCASGERRAEE